MKLVLVIFIICAGYNEANDFPDNFQFGVSTASYQIEGAWNMSGKGENIWDYFVHKYPEKIADRSNGDIACDSYHKIDEDIKLLIDLGIDFYRFSISWSRILPTGFSNNINLDGIRYYNEIINKLLIHHIEPFVTMYHWDMPQPLQDIGGWTNPLIADIFKDYAKVLFNNFGDRVKLWITINEPTVICKDGYGLAKLAPSIKSESIGIYLCGHTILRAHGKVYKLYSDEFRLKQNGQIGLNFEANWFEPNSTSFKNVKAAERMMKMNLDWFLHPVYSKTGDYPSIMKERIAEISQKENWPKSRLPKFTKSDLKMIYESCDFIGLSHYTTYLVSEKTDFGNINGTTSSFKRDCGVIVEQDSNWPKTASTWQKVVPWGIYKTLIYIKNEYNNPPVYMMENGYSDKGEINDYGRINFMKMYLTEISKAIKDGCSIKGYSFWSFLDNFEWIAGYTERYGLHFVDFNDPKRPRTLKLSASVYKNIINTHNINTMNITIVN